MSSPEYYLLILLNRAICEVKKSAHFYLMPTRMDFSGYPYITTEDIDVDTALNISDDLKNLEEEQNG